MGKVTNAGAFKIGISILLYFDAGVHLEYEYEACSSMATFGEHYYVSLAQTFNPSY